MTAVLKRVARSQTTITVQNLLQETETEGPLPIAALVSIDELAKNTGPLLSALVSSPDADVNPEFREILAGLGYEVPRTDRALHLVWKREVERTHAFYADPPRAMPASLVPRA
ncbi:hypothetical protein AB0K60_33555 [Thermopolyspora sp. NPDC052614]|uniref:hypothetical protein n=1 Tax=Thermopolyspora sp. NPDC052614 TaxID=3155682 RepID=UPI003426F3E9